MAVIKSGASTDQWTIDPTSKAGRVTLYDATGRETSLQSKQTYCYAGNFTPAATPTDIITIFGSASKTVRIISFILWSTATAQGSGNFILIRRSAVNAAGTFVAATGVKADTNNNNATATVGHYTANPGGLGGVVGNMHYARIPMGVAPPAASGIYPGYDFLTAGGASLLDQVFTVRGINDGICLNFAGAALVAGQTHGYTIITTEE